MLLGGFFFFSHLLYCIILLLWLVGVGANNLITLWSDFMAFLGSRDNKGVVN